MKLITGNMWNDKNEFDVLCVPANAIVKPPDNRLVMGAGFAKQVLEHYRGIDYYLGKKIYRLRRKVYGLVTSDHFFPLTICAFQTKIHWEDDARLDVIGYSTIELLRFINQPPKPKRVDMAFPGIGLGNLDPDVVMHTLKHLPDIVNVWRLEDEIVSSD